jgi:hypothetical protein
MSIYNFYVEDIESYIKFSETDYFIDQSPKIHILENGIILPPKLIKAVPGPGSTHAGGVADAYGNFVSGHIQNISRPDARSNVSCAYSISQEITHIKSTIVYGGVARGHFGHALTESLSRMWWFLENRDSGYKFAFVSLVGETPFLDFYRMLGLREEDIILIKEPTRFDSIIVPEQSCYLTHGYTDKTLSVYDAIRDSVAPAGGMSKVYLTRTKLVPQNIINEEYFEEYYRSLGYEVIAPEQLSLKDQIAILAGAKEIACVGGTLSHLILFCQDDIKISILCRTKYPLSPQFWMNQARRTQCTFIDVSMNFLPDLPYGVSYLCMPTVYWKQYVSDQYNEFRNDDRVPMRDFSFEYITSWAKSSLPWAWRILRKWTLADVMISMQKYLFGNELDGSTKKMLSDIANWNLNNEKRTLNLVSKRFAKLQQRHQALQERYKRLKSSLSWKLTAPIRAIGRILGLPKKRKNT